jgi:SnoaL-like domain
LGTNFIETPEISGVRSIVHSALFLTFFYLGFIRKWKCHSITTYDQDNEKIREVVTTWMRATAEGDLETVLSLIAEDAVFLLPDQPPMRGREAFAAALRSAPGQVRIEGKPTMSFFPSSSGPGATSPVVIRTRAMRWPA